MRLRNHLYEHRPPPLPAWPEAGIAQWLRSRPAAHGRTGRRPLLPATAGTAGHAVDRPCAGVERRAPGNEYAIHQLHERRREAIRSRKACRCSTGRSTNASAVKKLLMFLHSLTSRWTACHSRTTRRWRRSAGYMRPRQNWRAQCGGSAGLPNTTTGPASGHAPGELADGKGGRIDGRLRSAFTILSNWKPDLRARAGDGKSLLAVKGEASRWVIAHTAGQRQRHGETAVPDVDPWPHLDCYRCRQVRQPRLVVL